MGIRITVIGATGRTFAVVSLCRSIHHQFNTAMITAAWLFSIDCLSQFSASMANKNVLGMSGICGKKIAGKQVNILTALKTRYYLNPKEVFDMGGVRATQKTFCPIELTDFLF
jgi:hypothetical protein